MSRIPIPPPTEPINNDTGQMSQPWYHYFAQSAAESFARDAKSFFHVTLNSTDQSVTAATPVKLLFNHEVIDTDSCFDSTAATFAPIESGYYQFTVAAYAAASTAGFATQTAIYRNSSQEFAGTAISAGVSTAAGTLGVCSGVLYIGTTDSVAFYVNSPSTVISGTPSLTYAFGYKIGST